MQEDANQRTLARRLEESLRAVEAERIRGSTALREILLSNAAIRFRFRMIESGSNSACPFPRCTSYAGVFESISSRIEHIRLTTAFQTHLLNSARGAFASSARAAYHFRPADLFISSSTILISISQCVSALQ
jgi:hypothetical protein